MTARLRTLPLTVWAALLSLTTVLGTVAATAAVLWARGDLDLQADEALAGGAVVGLLLSVVGVCAAGALARALRELQAAAVLRLGSPAGGGQTPRTSATPLSRELDELARVLDALHARVRLADELGERHRQAAVSAGAGVSELLTALVTAEEGARGQLAAELHDTVAQSLMIARGLLDGPSGPVDLVQVTDYVEDAEEQLRAVMARTRPAALRDGDLASAIGGLRADLRSRYALQVHLAWPDAPAPLPLASAITAYRFCQEALLNVVKHADVDDARLELVVEPDRLVVTVSDDGPGFAPELVRPDRGRRVGLGLLRERARVSGGSVEVLSAPGAGTRLVLRLPLAPRPGTTPADGGADGVVPEQRAEPDRTEPAPA